MATGSRAPTRDEPSLICGASEHVNCQGGLVKAHYQSREKGQRVLGQREWTTLAEYLRKIGYGLLFDLHIEDGKPRVDRPMRFESHELVSPPPHGSACERTSKSLNDDRFRRFIAKCEWRRNVVIPRLTVQNGQPHAFDIEGVTDPA